MKNIRLLSYVDLIILIDSYEECLYELLKYIVDPNCTKEAKYSKDFIYKLNCSNSDIRGIKNLTKKLYNTYMKLSNQWEAIGFEFISEYENSNDFDLDTDLKKYKFLNKCSYKINSIKITSLIQNIDSELRKISTGIESILLYLLDEYTTTMYERIEAYSWCKYLLENSFDNLRENFNSIKNMIDELSDKELFIDLWNNKSE